MSTATGETISSDKHAYCMTTIFLRDTYFLKSANQHVRVDCFGASFGCFEALIPFLQLPLPDFAPP